MHLNSDDIRSLKFCYMLATCRKRTQISCWRISKECLVYILIHFIWSLVFNCAECAHRPQRSMFYFRLPAMSNSKYRIIVVPTQNGTYAYRYIDCVWQHWAVLKNSASVAQHACVETSSSELLDGWENNYTDKAVIFANWNSASSVSQAVLVQK